MSRQSLSSSHGESLESVEATEPIAPQSLASLVYDRRAEYIVSENITIKIGCWNVAACHGVEEDIASWLVKGQGVTDTPQELNRSSTSESGNRLESIVEQETRWKAGECSLPLNDPGTPLDESNVGLYVIALQEIVNIASPAEALSLFHKTDPGTKWKVKLEAGLPKGCKLVTEFQMSGLFTLVYASESLAPRISSVSAKNVATGLLGFGNNKGAVAIRLVIDETTSLVFVNSHLAAGSDKTTLDRRNWDAGQISSRIKFDPIVRTGLLDDAPQSIGDEDFTFWMGDLNYRLADLPGDDVRRLFERQASLLSSNVERFGTARPETSINLYSERSTAAYNLTGQELASEEDPDSLQNIINTLLKHDQLRDQMRKGNAFFDGWREGPITFFPSYKYDVGKVYGFDSSEKRRGPSYCDRILYRSKADFQHWQSSHQAALLAKTRDLSMQERGLDKSEEDILYDYDPDVDGIDPDETLAEPDNQSTDDSNHEEPEPTEIMKLNYYVSHQRVISSDHKPLSCLVTLQINAIDSQKKAQVYNEVAKELDRSENDAKPNITLAVDHNGEPPEKDPEHGLNFGEIRYASSKTRALTIANTGQVPATFKMLGSGENGQLLGWIDVVAENIALATEQKMSCAESLVLDPGETITMKLSTRLTTPEHIQVLNGSGSNVSEVIIFRVDQGRDHFLTLHAKPLRTCLGVPLDLLIRLPEGGIRNIADLSALQDQAIRWSAPQELFKLITKLEQSVDKAAALVSMTGAAELVPWANKTWPFVVDDKSSEVYSVKVEELVDSLDRGVDLPKGPGALEDCELLGQVLMLFLQLLPDGVVDSELFARLAAVVDSKHAKKQDSSLTALLEVLSGSSHVGVTLSFLTMMIGRIATELSPTLMEAARSNKPELRASSGALDQGAVMENSSAYRKQLQNSYLDILAPLIFKDYIKGKPKQQKIYQKQQIDIMQDLLASYGF